MLYYKKTAFGVSVAAVMIVAVVSLSLVVSKQMKATPENSSNQGTELNSITESLSSTLGAKYNREKLNLIPI